MLASDRQERLVAAERQRDPVLDGEAGVAPRDLHGVHDLARLALAPQRLVERQVQRDRMAALALDAVALEREHRDQEVLGRQLVVAPVDGDGDRAAVAHGGGGTRRVQRGDGRGGARHRGAEAGSERAVVRLDLVPAELVVAGDEAHALDVELVAHDLGEALDGRALATGGHDDGLGERLAHLHPRRTARGEPEAHRLARGRHRRLELLVTRRERRGGRKVAQVHARERRVEVVVDLVGDERAERREQLADRHEAVAQRREGVAVAGPEAGA